CHTRYYHNYFVHDHTLKQSYYSGCPEVLQISKKYFMESSLVERLANLMTVTWASTTNCAWFYNMGFGNPDLVGCLPCSWPINLHMDCENVWDAFFLQGLLGDHANRGSVLELHHHVNNNTDHLHPVLEARNERMAGPGQPQWNHACEKCTWVTLAEDGIHHRSIHVTVTDGVTLGHPCCAVHDCQEPLYSQCDIYCVRHAHKNRECVVVECTRLREGDWKTCAGKAWGEGDEEMYVDCDGMILEEDTVLHEYEVSCAGKTAAGNQKIQARFGRQRTHNEELCVATCGVILECTTFFGSEAPNGVWLFWKGLFPMQASMLHCQFHDNNCKILPMLKNHPDPHFSHTIFPVDVFHFKSKHKESDQFCAKHCNLMNWPKLLTE
ncbi:hypothetical protein K439DRAFT_1279272, partial [Ramaria rubella]